MYDIIFMQIAGHVAVMLIGVLPGLMVEEDQFLPYSACTVVLEFGPCHLFKKDIAK